jgi:serine/threonine protein kinase
LAGIVHRDVKPSNIFYTRSQTGLNIVLADFDRAAIITDSKFQCAGTIPYIAPEMLYDWPIVDYVCDIWSAAVVICEVVSPLFFLV